MLCFILKFQGLFAPDFRVHKRSTNSGEYRNDGQKGVMCLHW